MNTLLLIVAIIIGVLAAIALYRVAAGRTVFDRILAASLIGTNGLLMLLVIGFIFGRIDMFVDIAITYAVLNFVVTIVLSKYFERKRERP